jgi:hypothetical protein
MRIVMAVAVAALFWPGVGPAAAQTPEERMEAAKVRAAEAGIPTELLESKIAEGRAKGVPPDRIADAVERRRAALERARRALAGRPDVTVDELVVGADAVEAGVSDVVLRAVAESAPRERRVVAIAALEQLVQLGHVPEQALERVRAALRRGPEALLNLPAEAAREAGRPGVRPDTQDAPPAGVRPPTGVPAPGTRPLDAQPTAGRPEGLPGR